MKAMTKSDSTFLGGQSRDAGRGASPQEEKQAMAGTAPVSRSAKHTPGPWVVRPAVCRNDHPDTSADVHGPQGQFVADCGCHEYATANAKLIAAAPALADALERALEEGDHPRDCPFRHDEADCECWRSVVRAALRAAGRLP